MGNHVLKTYSYYKRQYLPSHTLNTLLIAIIIISNPNDIDRIELQITQVHRVLKDIEKYFGDYFIKLLS